MRLSLRLASILVVAASLFSAPLWAARPTIAVLPFGIDRNIVITDGRNVLTATIEDQSSLLVDELVHQLVASRKFDVLERARVDDLLQEKEFQGSDAAAPEVAARLAQLLGADYFVLGRIERLGAHSEQKAMPYSTRSYLQQQAYIDLYLRIVDVRTGRIVAAEKFLSEAKVRDPRPTDSIGRLLVAQAAQEMVTRIVDNVFPLRVARLEGTTVYLNRGSDGSLQAGDVLTVYRQGEEIRDQDNGELLGHTEQEVAQLKVLSVEARFAKAEPIGQAELREGMLVRKRPAPAPAAPAELPPGPRW